MAAKTLKLLTEEELRRALEGHTNVLASAEEELARYFRTLTCPYCNGSEIFRKVNPAQLFKPGEMLPNYLACCKACGCEFEPYTKLLLSLPRPSRVS